MTDAIAPMFAPISDQKTTSEPALTPASNWRPILPVPPDAPQLPTHPLGSPSASWAYRDAAGNLLFIVCRFDLPDGSKKIRPLTFCKDQDGRCEWRWQAVPPSRPLYRLDHLAAQLDAPVMVCEGEKAADAAAALFPEYVTVTSPNGAKAADKANWLPLRGRRVVIWPDHDKEGRAYANAVARLAFTAGAAEVRVVDVPDDFPLKWDLADDLPEGWDIDGLRDLLVNAAARTMPTKSVTPDTQGVELMCASNIQPKPIEWLWAGWLAVGKLHILAGSAGTGKTTIAVSMGATVSAGGRWPDGSKTSGGRVLIWSGEDDPADVLLPRFLACGADVSRIHFVGNLRDASGCRAFDPARDMDALMVAARDMPDIKLLIIDPVSSAVAGDSHKNTEVRRSLQPLVDFAAMTGCAVLGITHFTKGTQGRDPMERVTGSLAFGALARVVMCTAKPAEDTESRRLVRGKSNIGPDGDGYLYDLDLVSIPNHDGIVGQRIVWGGAIEGNARELLEQVERYDDDGKGARAEAKLFLLDILSNGPVKTTTVLDEGEAAGFTVATLRRAKDDLSIKVEKSSMRGGWVWRLCEETAKEDAKAPNTME